MCRTFYCCHAKTNLHEEYDRYTLRVEKQMLETVHLNHIECEYVCVHKCLRMQYVHVHTNYDRKLRKFFGHCTFKQFQFIVRIPF